MTEFPILAIDPGERNFGLAWASNRLAVDVIPSIRVSHWQISVDKTSKYIKELKIKTVIIGLPESGTTVKIAKSLAKKLKNTFGVEVILFPETLTSKIAWQKLSRAKFKFKAKKEWEDSYAALELLTTFIETKETLQKTSTMIRS